MLFFFIRFCKPVPADLALIAYHLKLKTENSTLGSSSANSKKIDWGVGVTRSVVSGPRRCVAAHALILPPLPLTLPFLILPILTLSYLILPYLRLRSGCHL